MPGKSIPPNSSHETEVDVTRNFPPLGNWSRQVEHQRKRLEWRKEILNGNPDKVISRNFPQASRLVVTFITRGSPRLPHGQGMEILRFRPPKGAAHFPTAYDWTYFAMDTSLILKNKKEDVITSAIELSKRPLAYLLPKLDVKKDLKLVRKSKPLLWDGSTVLESFLYRIVEKKEDPQSAAGKDLDERLGGPSLHGWYQTSEIQSLLMSNDRDLVCTALNAVFFPPPLSAAIDSIFVDKESRPDQLALRALEILYLCVQIGHARLAFKFYPIPPPPPYEPENVLCDKRRAWGYWTEVLAWQLSKLREDAQASISYGLLKSLSAVKDSVHDPKVTLDELETLMVAAIAAEADRLRYATETLIHQAACECLRNPSLAPSQKSSGKMHIITSGDSMVVMSVITRLITHVFADNSAAERNPTSTKNGEIVDLKITIAESRPLSEGVILASKLMRVVDSHIQYRADATKTEECAPMTQFTADVGNSLLCPDFPSPSTKAMSERNTTWLQLPRLGLSHLLADWDAKKEKKGPKVTVQVISDAAVVGTIVASRNSGNKPIILLSADCILPNGNSVNKVGTAQMAWAGKSCGGVVLILCGTDRIHPKGLPVPSKPNHNLNQLKIGWKSSIPEEVLRDLQKSSHVKISNPTHEHIDQKHVTGYMTDLGLMQNKKLKDFLNLRTELQNTVWPMNDLTK